MLLVWMQNLNMVGAGGAGNDHFLACMGCGH